MFNYLLELLELEDEEEDDELEDNNELLLLKKIVKCNIDESDAFSYLESINRQHRQFQSPRTGGR